MGRKFEKSVCAKKVGTWKTKNSHYFQDISTDQDEEGKKGLQELREGHFLFITYYNCRGKGKMLKYCISASRAVLKKIEREVEGIGKERIV